MPTVEAPVIRWEMENWKALGGLDSGIVGDPNHDYGFHIGARYLPADDYSRMRSRNGADGPYVDWDYACAGDFNHRGLESLRIHHRKVLAGLMAGKYPMICEFIGKPWADRPVYYWARWNGIKTLQKYTGSGHDNWSHISWDRADVDKKANLWEVDVPLDTSDVNKVWKTDGILPAPDLTATGDPYTPPDAEAAHWLPSTYLERLYENQALMRKAQKALEAKVNALTTNQGEILTRLAALNTLITQLINRPVADVSAEGVEQIKLALENSVSAANSSLLRQLDEVGKVLDRSIPDV